MGQLRVKCTAEFEPFRVGAMLLLCVPALGLAQQDPPFAGSGIPPVVVYSPATSIAAGMIKLDVVVTNKSGKIGYPACIDQLPIPIEPDDQRSRIQSA